MSRPRYREEEPARLSLERCLSKLLLVLAFLLVPQGGGDTSQQDAMPPEVASISPRIPPPPDRVILVTTDTLRVNHLQAFGYPRATGFFITSMAELIGLEFQQPEQTLTGKFIIPLLLEDNIQYKECALLQRVPENEKAKSSLEREDGLVVAIVTERYKYIFHSETEDELFDLRSESYEQESAIDDALESARSVGSGPAQLYSEESWGVSVLG